jgi:predicted metal-binding membrane protein
METLSRDAASPLERIIRRDRLLIGFGLSVTIALAWIHLVRAAASMSAMTVEAQMHAAMGMADMRTWGASDFIGLFVMWSVMMVAMMLPSAAPVILLVLNVYRRRDSSRARVAAVAFVAGYLLAWTMFSGAAAAGQVALHRTALLTADMRLDSAVLSGGILLVAGVYQWLPPKNWCLTHCQSPLGFLSRYWREGAMGGLTMGLRHGLFCVGCCWLVMTVLFVVGIMNLVWVAALAAFVLVEKLIPRGRAFGRAAGVVIGAWGLYLFVSG